ncbi:TonB-dependent receptor plug domain-containing protein [Saccharicrinis sp. GN24d3]|uniref:TonB-dependent receptor plug domain-containing protein n=1 Tax=Saccharicrinis sp. GN24d3 TaxID=3458416 RepID=UPI0040361BD1
MLFRKYITVVLLMFITASVIAQENKRGINSLTRGQVLEMTIEELSLYDLEELTKLMDIVGASSLDELYELLLNKDVTSASKSEESLFDSPLSTTVLSHDQIVASGATCIPEALRLVPGMIVREKTNGNYDIHIRGNDNLPAKNMMLYSENTNTLVMLNGRPVFNYSHGGTLWESLPISIGDVDRIEVVRGPSSALYGSNAVTGVINIMTKDIDKDSPLFSGNFQAGNQNTYIGDVAFRKQINEKLGLGITANYEYRNRNTDKIYIYNNPDAMINGVTVGNGWYTADEIATIEKPSIFNDPAAPENDQFDYLFSRNESNESETSDIYDAFPDPELSKDKLGVNGYLTYQFSPSTNIHLSAGYQSSDNISSSYGDIPTPYSARNSSTGYVDVSAHINKLSFQANYNGGRTDFMTGNEGFELDLKQTNALAEYDLKLNNLKIRPGVGYQSISYDDTPYLTQEGQGYLNGERSLEIFAASMRLDYTAFEKLRFVAALRAENYSQPDDWYGSWQLVSSYKINDNHLIRAVYSRANQSAFLVNSFSNYSWQIVNRDYPSSMYFGGNDNYALKTMDMVELGYRARPAKSVLLDLEAFYQKTNDFGALMPDSTTISLYNPLGVMNGQDAIILPEFINVMYQNMDLTAEQLGVSIGLDWVVNKKLVLNAHATYQNTKLDNYSAVSRDQLISDQALDAGSDEAAIAQEINAQLTAIGYGLATGTIDPAEVGHVTLGSSTLMPTDLEDDVDNKATPTFWGSIGLNYKPFEKLDINSQAYFYGEQTFVNQYGTVPIDSKFLLNAKITYHAGKNISFYLNGRNILDNDQPEFGYMDNIGGLYLAGLQFNF